jgi:hypothetical protein
MNNLTKQGQVSVSSEIITTNACVVTIFLNFEALTKASCEICCHIYKFSHALLYWVVSVF